MNLNEVVGKIVEGRRSKVILQLARKSSRALPQTPSNESFLVAFRRGKPRLYTSFSAACEAVFETLELPQR
jgi:hypothetical protein